MKYCSFPLVPLATRLSAQNAHRPARLERQDRHDAQGKVHDEACGMAHGLFPQLLVGGSCASTEAPEAASVTV